MEIAKKAALFTLFHHDINYNNSLLNFDTNYLNQLLKEDKKYSVKNLADILYSIVNSNIEGFSDNDISLTLTGGMDSRLILACLLKAGVKPNCFTYGNPAARDVIFAKEIANKLGLPYQNAIERKPDKDWYFKWVLQTIKIDQGNSHLHRAHRTAAIAEHTDFYHSKVLFTGHLGGESLRGLTYNNYFASPFFEIVNERISTLEKAVSEVLDNYFVREDNINSTDLLETISNLSWMKHDKNTNKFFFLFDLVGKIHHAQDLRLFRNYLPNVVPVFLQNNYLEALFSSKYNFMVKNEGLFGRLKNPYIYCQILDYLYPKLLDYKFSNGFSPREYQKGLWYYIPVKLYRDAKNKTSDSPTFSYGQWYIDFVKEHALNIDPEIWEIYDKKKYFKTLENNLHRKDEGYWHKFSNPIFFDLVNKFNKGKL